MPGNLPNVAVMLRATGGCDVTRAHMSDILEFLADVHTLTKVKSNIKGMTVGLNEDTLGGTMKASLAQYLALEISKGNGRDSRSVNRYLPWLYNLPANTAAQGQREFLECVAHVRLMSWLLLGSVNHTLKFGSVAEIGYVVRSGVVFLVKCSAFAALGRMYVIRGSDYRDDID